MFGNKIKFKTTWDLSPLLSGDNDPTIDHKLEEVHKANYEFINKWKDRTDYLENPQILKEALTELDVLDAKYGTGGNVEYYFGLRSALEQDNPDLKAQNTKLSDFSLKIVNDIQFFIHRLSKVPAQIQEQFLAAPELLLYKHFLSRLFAESKYLLSEPEEKIINLKSATSYSNWVNMTSDFLSRETRLVLDESGKKQKKTLEEISKLMQSKSKKVRDISAKAFNDILKDHMNVAEVELNSILQDKKVDDELRKLPRPDSITHIGDDMDSEVVDEMLSAVEARYAISQKYYELKAKLMGLPILAYHERNVEYGSLDQRSYNFETAANLVDKVFCNLDPEFGAIFKHYLENGRLDVYPRKGKTAGAFEVGGLLTQPGYVLLNHTDKLSDVTTIAHEMGHAINSELSRKKQNALNFGISFCTAEVASTFMEDFVLNELEKAADKELKLSIMMMRLNEDVSSIMRQVACYRFEQDLHKTFREKGYLAKDLIGKLFQKHMAGYMGSFVEQSPGAENWWVYWGHIRRFFYVYTYASGLLISKSLQKLYKEDHKYIEKMKEFLSAGTSDSPKNIFAKLGVNISDKQFWENGLQEIDERLTETWEFAKELGKI